MQILVDIASMVHIFNNQVTKYKLSSLQSAGLKLSCHRWFLLFFKQGCGREIFGSSGVLTSAGYPSNYRERAECIWIIKATDPTHQVQFTIHDMDIEDDPDCDYDYLEIRYPVFPPTLLKWKHLNFCFVLFTYQIHCSRDV